MISPDTLIADIVTAHPGAEKVFGAHGLPCAGCHVSTRETVRGGASVHRLDLDALVADLRRFVADGTVPPPRPRPGPTAKTPPMELQKKAGIEHVVAVMSGKGGVGKSLVTALLAVMNGYAIGGGHVLHVLCDLTIASDNAKFGQVGPKVGSVDPGFGTMYLARIVGENIERYRRGEPPLHAVNVPARVRTAAG